MNDASWWPSSHDFRPSTACVGRQKHLGISENVLVTPAKTREDARPGLELGNSRCIRQHVASQGSRQARPQRGRALCVRAKLCGHRGASTAPPLRKNRPRELSRWIGAHSYHFLDTPKSCQFCETPIERFSNSRANCFAVGLEPSSRFPCRRAVCRHRERQRSSWVRSTTGTRAPTFLCRKRSRLAAGPQK